MPHVVSHNPSKGICKKVNRTTGIFNAVSTAWGLRPAAPPRLDRRFPVIHPSKSLDFSVCCSPYSYLQSHQINLQEDQQIIWSPWRRLDCPRSASSSMSQDWIDVSWWSTHPNPLIFQYVTPHIVNYNLAKGIFNKINRSSGILDAVPTIRGSRPAAYPLIGLVFPGDLSIQISSFFSMLFPV